MREERESGREAEGETEEERGGDRRREGQRQRDLKHCGISEVESGYQ